VPQHVALISAIGFAPCKVQQVFPFADFAPAQSGDQICRQFLPLHIAARIFLARFLSWRLPWQKDNQEHGTFVDLTELS
jgi:hypothetical protein